MLHDDELREICAEAQTFGLSPYDAALTAADREFGRMGDIDFDPIDVEMAFTDYETKCRAIMAEA